MKKFLIAISLIILVLIGAIVSLPFLVPASTYERVIETRLESMLGREVTLEGKPSVKVFPQLGAEIKGVKISNADGFDDPYFAKADSLTVAVKWLPLLSKRVEIAALKFDGAEVLLHQKSSTENNWTFEPQEAATTDEAPSDKQEPGNQSFDALIPEAQLINSRLKFRDDVSGQTYDANPINLTAQLDGLDKPVKLDGSLTINEMSFDISAELGSIAAIGSSEEIAARIKINSDPADFTYDGWIVTSETPYTKARFSINLKDPAALLNFADIKSDIDVTQFGKLSAEGEINGTSSDLKLTDLKVNQSSGWSNAEYTGDVTVSDSISVSGALDASLKDIAPLLSALKADVEIDPKTVGRIDIKSGLNGPVDALKLTNVSMKQKGSSLESSFDGAVSLSDQTPRVTGQLKLTSDDLRSLLTSVGFDASVYQSSAFRKLNADLSLSPQGNQTEISLNRFVFDDLSVDGSFSFDISGKTPYVKAELTTPKLDVSPYLTSSEGGKKQESASDSWSEEPIDLSVLKTINGDFKLDALELTDGKAMLRDAKISGSLKDGKFTGTILSKEPDGGRSGRTSLIDPFYNGSLETNFSLASLNDQQNRLALSAEGSGIAASELVKLLTGKDVLNGVGALKTDISMSGSSLSDFVRTMNGSYTASVDNGAIKGINLGQLLRSAQDALVTGKLPTALSPEDETDFSSLKLNGAISDGVANMQSFMLKAPYVQAEASGTVDLYNRKLDIKFYPKVSADAAGENLEAGIKGFGIPLRISGNWSSVKGSLDTAYLTDLAKKAATDKLKNEVESRLGGLLGSVGGKSETPETDASENPAEGSETPTEQKAPDIEDAAETILKDLFGRKPKN